MPLNLTDTKKNKKKPKKGTISLVDLKGKAKTDAQKKADAKKTPGAIKIKAKPGATPTAKKVETGSTAKLSKKAKKKTGRGAILTLPKSTVSAKHKGRKVAGAGPLEDDEWVEGTKTELFHPDKV